MRLTIKNPTGTYRIPLVENSTMYMLEVEKADVHKQESRFIPAYFGRAVDKLGQYEELGAVEEIRDKLARLDKLEGREAG